MRLKSYVKSGIGLKSSHLRSHRTQDHPQLQLRCMSPLSSPHCPILVRQGHPNILVEFLTDNEFLAWLLNLRGTDIPYNPLFQSYLFIGLSRVVLFADSVKVTDEVAAYLRSIGVERREYNDLWTFLRRREWGEGKVRRVHISYCSF
jgi:hypothetical protein